MCFAGKKKPKKNKPQKTQTNHVSVTCLLVEVWVLLIKQKDEHILETVTAD